MKPRSGEHIGISSLPMGKAEAVNENPFRAISENVIKITLLLTDLLF